MGRPNTLIGAGAIFALTWLIHTADHVRRGLADTADGVTFAGTLAAMLIAVCLTLIATGHRAAAASAAVVGPTVAFGVAAAHLLPPWGYFSESLLFDSTADRWALLAVIPEIVAALWLGWVGWRELAANNYQIAPANSARAGATGTGT
ncbi:MAG: hypothetical protein AAF467_03580 [Actinomycetota bacterium]